MHSLNLLNLVLFSLKINRFFQISHKSLTEMSNIVRVYIVSFFSFYLIFKIRILHSTRIGIFTNIFTYIAAHRESNYDSSRLYFLAAHFCTWNFTENDKSTQNIYSMKYFILLLCNLSSMAKKVVVYMCEHDKFLLSS